MLDERTPVLATNHLIPLFQFQNKRRLIFKAECVCVSEEGFLGRGAELLKPQCENPTFQGPESLKRKTGILLTFAGQQQRGIF